MSCAATTTIREALEEDLRFEIAAILRDWIHETPLSLCGAGADTCPDWKLAFEVRDLIWPPVAAAVAAVGPGQETDEAEIDLQPSPEGHGDASSPGYFPASQHTEAAEQETA